MEPYQLQMTRGDDGHKLVHLPTGGCVAVPFDPLYAAERAAAEAARAIDPPDELRCKYKSTRCLNLRAKKRNGELHNFCQIHRERANQNQRNSEQRKRYPKQGARRNERDPEDYPRHLHLLEPLQGEDSSHLEPTYDELKEAAMLLSIPDRDRE
ncbi:unnamed protein product [Hyaloperonospora brassicae]|uniref:Uncharacterized protein n=1 Tax=Hyaloperonospora brassicae TaxID=162125 RepID=A0AAV0TI86_HYABA|nr:unnamed protein product [Hyaloperonospora brassicae]